MDGMLQLYDSVDQEHTVQKAEKTCTSTCMCARSHIQIDTIL